MFFLMCSMLQCDVSGSFVLLAINAIIALLEQLFLSRLQFTVCLVNWNIYLMCSQ
jgi:hypothetical protein